MERKGLTIYRIAEEAGVSAATVSRTINRPEKVKPEKREKVMAVIRKYGFKPNVFAKSLKDTRTGVIGILSASVDSPFYGRLVAECIRAAESEGYILLTASCSCREGEEPYLLEKILEQRVESVILLGGSMDSRRENERSLSIVSRIAESVPVVVMGEAQGLPCYEVRIDEAGAMEQAMEYLIRLGHREIAFWGGEEEVSSSMEKRLAYFRLLRKYGLSQRAQWVQYGGYDQEDGYRLMKKMEKGGLPTAVICINDQFASGLMNAAFDAGLRVPEDFSVIAFDDTYLAKGVRPALSSVACDYGELAQKLIGTAMGAVQGKDIEQLQLLKPRLVERKSCRRI